jgi:hypothetical protein
LRRPKKKEKANDKRQEEEKSNSLKLLCERSGIDREEEVKRHEREGVNKCRIII